MTITQQKFRVERDSMGDMHVPATAGYGAQTARALENFPISGLRFPRRFIWALGLIKQHSAAVNRDLQLLDAATAAAVEAAAAEVLSGKFDEQFPLDIFQTGSGTSTNMNANEVIARRADELRGAPAAQGSRVHPNDDVNRGQSSNDVIPSALHLAALAGLARDLVPALHELRAALLQKAEQFAGVLKIGRTHLQDATPMRLGQEFGAYAAQLEQALAQVHAAQTALGALALGGTAVGTGLNTHPEFAARVIRRLAEETGLSLREAPNHFAAQGAMDAVVEASGALKRLAVALIKIANDIRWLGSGPRCGLGELRLPTTQPGSSIMPGKVNPVMSEMLIQVGAQVLGNDATITFCGTFGFFELNTMWPVAAHNLLQSIELLANGMRVFSRRCVAGLEADAARCGSFVEQSLAMATALAPVIGYDAAASIAREAHASGRTVREVAGQKSGLRQEQLDQLLDPARQAG